MNTIIINADDCGKNRAVNDAIKNCIDEGIITSTTIMANMDDLEGALNLYNNYSDKISFGFHLNLDEGTPIIDNELLLKKGFYRNDNGRILMAVPNSKSPLNSDISHGLYQEMEAQLQKLINLGIRISHIDSHHHIHTAPFVLPLVLKLAQKYGINKIRGIRNYYPFSVNACLRHGWKIYAKLINKDCIFTDYFCSASEYFQSKYRVNNSTIELMCHPGHSKAIFIEEMKELRSFVKNADDSVEFKTYNY